MLIVGTVLRGQQLDVVVDGGMHATIITGSLNFTDGTTTFNSATVGIDSPPCLYLPFQYFCDN